MLPLFTHNLDAETVKKQFNEHMEKRMPNGVDPYPTRSLFYDEKNLACARCRLSASADNLSFRADFSKETTLPKAYANGKQFQHSTIR